MNMKKRKDFLSLEEYVSYLEVTVDELTIQIEEKNQEYSAAKLEVKHAYQTIDDKEYALNALKSQNQVLRNKVMDLYGLSARFQTAGYAQMQH